MEPDQHPRVGRPQRPAAARLRTGAVMTTHETGKVQDLPADNAARIAIYDVLAAAYGETKAISSDELFDGVIGRLRVLVPRELHLTGERAYVDEKVEACVAS